MCSASMHYSPNLLEGARGTHRFPYARELPCRPGAYKGMRFYPTRQIPTAIVRSSVAAAVLAVVSAFAPMTDAVAAPRTGTTTRP